MPRTARTRPHAAGLVAAAAAACLVAASVSPPAGAAVAGREMNLKFGTTAKQTNNGRTPLAVRTVTRNGGRVASTSGPSGGAVRLPAYQASNAPVAVLAITDTDGADDLAPGTARFTFGADFALDAKSQGSRTDNGNNLVQRGLYGHRMQFKLELDGNRPLCRIKGSGGAVSVKSSRTVAPGVWHRAVCKRSGSRVTLTVKRLSDGVKWATSRSRATGSLRPSSRSVPVSVGGKLNPNGSLARSADQFNGKVDNAFVNVF
jgi:hypothetical protein